MVTTLEAPAATALARIDFDFTDVGQIDTAGALLLDRLTATVPEERIGRIGLAEPQRVLLDEIRAAVQAPEVLPPKLSPIVGFLTALGRYGVSLAAESALVVQLLGGVALVLVTAIRHPSRVRFIPFIHQLERTCVNAAPIVLLMSFLIGAIIAQQGAFYFRRFGADLYVVDMVGVLTLREIAVLLTAVMVAGRSGSSFTAELGSMKMREEVDALQVIGLDPVEVLVVPRLIALMVALPILTFLADLASIFGAAVVCQVYGGIPTETFLQRLAAAVELRTFLVGIAKAPFMAMIIGLVACSEGLQVAGSAESLGARTTVSVVKSIFMVIVVDGIFAIFYAAVGV
ncbi:ABC transporter permease [Siculibacillus lacustris]|uniref:ABC transporter permease n=2 Tax=Siculibacillus lacustris TaxID=1549641 RepID=A0A4Q9VUJ4_9HYPH|nr:ABC transporter permease [Siculibacillus lacustris]